MFCVAFAKELDEILTAKENASKIKPALLPKNFGRKSDSTITNVGSSVSPSVIKTLHPSTFIFQPSSFINTPFPGDFLAFQLIYLKFPGINNRLPYNYAMR